MRCRLPAGIALAALLLFGCSAAPAPNAPADKTREDAPFELADDGDLEALHSEYRAMPQSADARPELRARLASEYERRIDEGLRRRERDAAYAAFTSLLSLWDPGELDDDSAQAGLGPYRDAFARVRADFARSGNDVRAATALFALATADPGRADTYLAEIDEIFAFADELAFARHGPGAQRSRPIEILEHAVRVVPTPEVLDRLVELYIERQKALNSQFRRSGADLRVIRAHGDTVLRATWSVLRAHAHAFRLDRAGEAIREITGFGDDAALRGAFEKATSADAGAREWLALAEAFRESGDEEDPLATLRICEYAIARIADSANLHLCAARRAASAEEIPLAVRHYERALELDPDKRDATSRLAELYEHRIGQLASAKRLAAAEEALTALSELKAGARERWPGAPLGTDLADGYAAMGRGLTSIGRLEQAEHYLEKASQKRPHPRALEHLGIIELGREHFARSLSHFERALAREPASAIERFDRARILRLASEAAEKAGDRARAEGHAEAALAVWERIGREHGPLRAGYQGQMLLEVGRLHWFLGDRDEATRAFERAVDADPDGASTHAGILAFLLVRGERDPALDVYHRALGSHEIDDDFKVYMSLWIAIDARLRGRPLDPLAERYLETRSGRLWPDALARWATERAELRTLAQSADTRDRRAEFLYYRAMLEAMPEDPERARELLRHVLATDMVLFFEYDMAREWLDRGFAVIE